MTTRALLWTVFFLHAGCVARTGFVCAQDDQCGGGGRCEPTHFCSFADATCAAGRRYGEVAGDLSNACVDGSIVDSSLADAPADARIADSGPDGMPLPDGGVTGCWAELGAGDSFTCALRSDNTVWCWGADHSYQLGYPDGLYRTAPVKVTALSGITQIALGVAHGCGLTTDHRVLCWGDNAYYSLANSDRNAHATPVEVTLAAGALSVAAGGETSCAVLPDHTVRCWGLNDRHQAGDFSTVNDRLVPVAVPGIAQATRVDVGENHACAVNGGSVVCWGRNDYGQLGDGTQAPRTLAPVATLLAGTVVDVAVGDGHSCARRDDGTVWCWGWNDTGAVGDTTTTTNPTPTKVAIPDAVAQIAVKFDSSCAVTVKGDLWCWGRDSYGELNDNQQTYSVPAPEKVLTGIAEVTIGNGHTCVRRTDGTIRCTGANHSGELGDNIPIIKTTPAQVSPGALVTNASSISMGGDSACIRRGAGDNVSCWGANDYGGLGDGTTNFQSAPVSGAGGLSFTAVAMGEQHSCGLKSDGTVWCWGRNYEGELGYNMPSQSYNLLPVQVVLAGSGTALTGISSITSGQHHSCARKSSDSSVWCWGSNSRGQLGYPAGTPPTGCAAGQCFAAVQVPSVTAVEIGAGTQHTCGRTGAGDVYCWGWPYYCQLGSAVTCADVANPTPVKVNGISNALQLAVGTTHNCVLVTGQVLCWGEGWGGQLGDGNFSSSATPVVVYQLTTATQIFAGDAATCAITSGTPQVVCWGADESGQLGDGTPTPNRGTPVGVPGLSGVTSLGLSNSTTCARKSDGTVWCWGLNDWGQLGIGTVLEDSTSVLAQTTCL